MIKFSTEEMRNLQTRHPWLAEFGDPLPVGLASLESPAPAALHFIDKKRKDRAQGGWPDGACVLVASGNDLTNVRAVQVPMPKIAIAALLADLRTMRLAAQRFEIHNGAWLAAGVALPEDCLVEPGAIVCSGALVGPRVTIGPNAVIRSGVVIGAGSRIQSGASIGEDGFGYAFDDAGGSVRLPHMGGVEIGADVDVGANSVICGGTIDPTRINAGSRIDGHVYVGHNAQIGHRSWVVAGAVVGGSSIIGDCVWVNTSAMVRTKVRVGDRAVVGAGAVVMKDVAPETRSRLRRYAVLDQILRERGIES
jgi:UDP-3-O-[3-hydroxymyristoyl] glucosamine N-acyltransferase LpxD